MSARILQFPTDRVRLKAEVSKIVVAELQMSTLKRTDSPEQPIRHLRVACLKDQPDHELVRRCRSGDTEAWNVLIGRYKRLIYYVTRQYLFDDAADDVFQDVCLKLLTHINRLDGGTIKNWLWTVTQRRCWRLAALGRRDFTDFEDDLRNNEHKTPAVKPASVEPEISAHLYEAVSQAMERLSERERRLLEMCYSDTEYSAEDIAKAMKLTPNSVRQLRHVAIQKIRTRLKRRGIRAIEP